MDLDLVREGRMLTLALPFSGVPFVPVPGPDAARQLANEMESLLKDVGDTPYKVTLGSFRHASGQGGVVTAHVTSSGMVVAALDEKKHYSPAETRQLIEKLRAAADAEHP